MVSSAGNTRGLIEALLALWQRLRLLMSSAGNTRGLIEATTILSMSAMRMVGLPRGIPAASLKHSKKAHVILLQAVFRGEYPRPH